MMDVRCLSCRLMWVEDRSKGDSPVSAHVFLCPRCGVLGKPVLREEPEKEE